MGHTSEFPLGIYWWTLKSPKSQTSGKMKKIEDVIILHICTKNHNHMRYSYWDTEWKRIFYHFGPFFTLFHPLTTQKSKFWKNGKKHLEMSAFFCNKKHNHVMSVYSDIECNRQFFVISGHFLLFCPTTDSKTKFWKKCKKHLEILSFYTYVR